MIASTLYCPRIIGRDAELSQLLRLAVDAIAGSSSVVMLSGEAGIGKTRLLDEFRAWATRRATVAAVTCPVFAPVPLGPIVGILESVAPASAAKHVAVAAPTMGQIKVFQQFSDALRTAAKTRPIVITIDDAHWADTATLEFVHFAARELADARVMILIAYRPEATDEAHAMSRATSRISRLRNVHEVRLTVLADIAIAEMLDATLGPERKLTPDVLRDVKARAEGNPLFAEELLKSAIESGVRQAPTTLRTLVAERVARMSEDQRRLLELSALIGRRFNAAFLERVATASHAEVIAFLRNAVRSHLLVEDRADVGWFHFRHALVRDEILAQILVVEARDLHLAIGRALECDPHANERASELSEHFWQAAARPECGRYARIAAERARKRFAFREAAEQFERALACAERDDDFELHEGAAAARHALGDRGALDHYERAAQIALESGERERAIDALLGLAAAKHLQRHPSGFLRELDRAEELERAAPDPGLRVRILVQRAQLGTAASNYEVADPALAEAEGLLEWGRPLDVCRFLMVRSYRERDARAALLLLDRAVNIANEIGDPRIVIATTGNRAVVSGNWVRAGMTVKMFEEALALCERHGDFNHTLSTHAHLANARIQAGLLEAARTGLRVLLSEPRPSSLVEVFRAEVALRLAVYLREDEFAQRADAIGAFERAAGHSVGYWGKLAAYLADFYACSGNVAAAEAVIGRLADTGTIGENEIFHCRELPSIAALGTRSHVSAIEAQIFPWRASENPVTLAHVALFDAYVAARFGNAPEVKTAAADAAGRFAALEMPLREAEAETLMGNVGRAKALMEASGARRLPRRAEGASKAVALTKPLTSREREIAALAAAGKSSQAIAEQLVLSVRTVEAHLGSAYSKLGVSSRTALSAALEVAG